MFEKVFGKKNKDLEIYALLTGELKLLSDVPDQVFAEKMMGDGVAIEPLENEVVSPVDGKIVQVFPTKHAIGIRSNNGIEILIHVGIDTVQLKGKGFTSHVKKGQKVKVEDLVLHVDFKHVKEQGKAIITSMIITNGEQVERLNKKELSPVTKGSDIVISVVVK